MKVADIINLKGNVPDKISELKEQTSTEGRLENEHRTQELQFLSIFIEHEAYKKYNSGKTFGKTKGKFDKKGITSINIEGEEHKVIDCSIHGKKHCTMPSQYYLSNVQIIYDRKKLRTFCKENKVKMPSYLWQGLNQVREIFAFPSNLLIDEIPELFAVRQSIQTLEMGRNEKYKDFAFRTYNGKYKPLPNNKDVFYAVKGLEKAFLQFLVRVRKEKCMGYESKRDDEIVIKTLNINEYPFITAINYIIPEKPIPKTEKT